MKSRIKQQYDQDYAQWEQNRDRAKEEYERLIEEKYKEFTMIDSKEERN